MQRFRFPLFVSLMACAVGFFGGLLLEHTTVWASGPATSRPTSRPASTPNYSMPPASTKPSPSTTPPPAPRLNKKDQMYRGILYIKQHFRNFLYKHGRDPNNPWLLSHSLLALGKDLVLADGTKAADRIVSGYLKVTKKNGKLILDFPQGTQKDRIEPHPFMHLKTFLEAGIPLNRTFRVGKHTITLQQMLDSAIHTFPSTPQGKEFGPLAWRMSLLYGRTPQNAWLWNNYEGKSVNFFRILFRFFKYANHQSNFLRVLRSKNVKIIPKRKQYIYAEACGGFHLLQAALRWMGHPALQRHTHEALNTHIELIFYRMTGEVNLYLSLFKQYQQNVAYRFVILLQQLKFLGHALETLADLHEWGLFNPTKDQKKQIRQALRLLLVTVVLLERLGFYKGIERLKQTSYQFYLDLLGDSAHAMHALSMLEKTDLYLP